MANREVNLTKRIMTTKGPRYCPVVESANGRIRPDVVMVDGQEERHPEGSYYIEWRQDGKRVRLSVGKDAQDANAKRLRKAAGVEREEYRRRFGRRQNGCLAAAIADYLDEVKLSKKPKTYVAYSTALGYFGESCHKLNGAGRDAQRRAHVRGLPAR